MQNFLSWFAEITVECLQFAWKIQLMLWDTIGFGSVFIQLAVVVFTVRFIIAPAFNGTVSINVGSSGREPDDNKRGRKK